MRHARFAGHTMKIPKEIILQVTRGFKGRSKGCIRLARIKAYWNLTRSYTSRHKRQSQFRTYWITKINAASREWRMPYAWLISGLKRGNIELDRKTLCTLAETEPVSFKAIVDESKRIMFTVPSKHRDVRFL